GHGLCFCIAHDKTAHHSVTILDCHRIYIVQSNFRLLLRFLIVLVDFFNMLSRCDLRYHASIKFMQFYLRRNNVGTDLPAVSHHGGGCFIAGTFNCQNYDIFFLLFHIPISPLQTAAHSFFCHAPRRHWGIPAALLPYIPPDGSVKGYNGSAIILWPALLSPCGPLPETSYAYILLPWPLFPLPRTSPRRSADRLPWHIPLSPDGDGYRYSRSI